MLLLIQGTANEQIQEKKIDRHRKLLLPCLNYIWAFHTRACKCHLLLNIEKRIKTLFVDIT